MAVSAPTSSAQAGVGGLAIAGSQSLAIAGDYDPEEHGFGTQRYHQGRSGVAAGGATIIPIIANYFFYPPGTVPGGAGDQPPPAQHQSYSYSFPYQPHHHPAKAAQHTKDGVLRYYGAARRLGSVDVNAAAERRKDDGEQDREEVGKNILDPKTYPIAGRIVSR